MTTFEVIFDRNQPENQTYNNRTLGDEDIFEFEFVDFVRTLDDGGNESWYEKIDVTVPDEFSGLAERKFDEDYKVVSYRVN